MLSYRSAALRKKKVLVEYLRVFLFPDSCLPGGWRRSKRRQSRGGRRGHTQGGQPCVLPGAEYYPPAEGKSDQPLATASYFKGHTLRTRVTQVNSGHFLKLTPQLKRPLQNLSDEHRKSYWKSFTKKKATTNPARHIKYISQY